MYVVGLENIAIFSSHNCGDLDSLEILSCTFSWRNRVVFLE